MTEGPGRIGEDVVHILFAQSAQDTFDTAGETLKSEVVNDPDGSERVFWDGVHFDGVTPTWKPEDL